MTDIIILTATVSFIFILGIGAGRDIEKQKLHESKQYEHCKKELLKK